LAGEEGTELPLQRFKQVKTEADEDISLPPTMLGLMRIYSSFLSQHIVPDV